MTDAEYEATKARVEPVLEKWRRWLGLRWWQIEYDWCREGIPAEDAHAVGYDVSARVICQWQYVDATIKLNVPFIAKLSDEQIEQMAAHEYAHILVNELRDVSDDWTKHEDRVATTLQMAFKWVREAALAEGRQEGQDG